MSSIKDAVSSPTSLQIENAGLKGEGSGVELTPTRVLLAHFRFAEGVATPLDGRGHVLGGRDIEQK